MSAKGFSMMGLETREGVLVRRSVNDMLNLKKIAAAFLLVVIVSLVYGYIRYQMSMPWVGLLVAAIVGISGKYLLEAKMK